VANRNDNALERQLQRGIAAAKAGDKASARQFLEAVVAQDDGNELAWIWLASVVPTTRERRICLEKVLKINPRNERARQALNQLVGVAGDTARGAFDPASMARTGAPARSGRNTLALFGGVLAGFLLLWLLLSFLAPTVEDVPVTATLRPADVMAVIVSPTPLPTTTPNFVIVRTRDLPTLPPTFTPTFTPSPTATTFPLPTPFALSDYGLLYASRAALEAQPSLYSVNLDGTGVQPVLENARDVAYDRTGERIAFVRDVTYPETQEGDFTIPAGTVGELFVAELNNLGQARQLTELKRASVYTPSFAPNGQQIAFASDYTGNFEVYVYDIPTQTTLRLTDNPGVDKDPHWSADGTRIVFTSDMDSPGFTEIYLYEFVDGGDDRITRITNDLGNSYAPRLSPNGQRIVYANDSSGNGDIYVIGVDGQRRASVVVHPSEDKSPIWSADGRFVLFLSNREDDVFQVYYVEPPSRAVVRVTRDGRDVSALSQRPDLLLRLVGQN
jgi:hypothetical protein